MVTRVKAEVVTKVKVDVSVAAWEAMEVSIERMNVLYGSLLSLLV
jgi:hypothetical protein